MKVEKRKLSTRRRLNEARTRGAKRFYEWWGRPDVPEDLRSRYDRVEVSGFVEDDIPLVVFEDGKKYLAAYEYEVDGKIDSKAEEIFQLTGELKFYSFYLFDFPEDGVIPTKWWENSNKTIIIQYYKGDINRLDKITVADGTPVIEALKDLTVKGAEEQYLGGYGDEWTYGRNDYDDINEAPDDEVGLSIFLSYKGELNGKYGKGMKEAVGKKAKRVRESSKRRLNEARAQGAKRFYERWGGERDYYDYLIDSYHLDDYDDDFYLDKYDKVYVYGITEDTPLVVFEDDKKYLAFCEYDTIGKIDPKAKEFFQITDPLNIRFFDLHEFPKDGVIDYNWMKTSARVETIIDVYKGDIDRLNRITVADGTPILEALKNLIVEGVEKAYDEGTAEEVYATHYQHNAIQSDVPELKVDLFYEGELNGEYGKGMRESVKKMGNKMKKSSKRRLNEARARGAKHFYEWDAAEDRAWLKAEDNYLDRLAGDLNKPDDGYLNYYDTVWVYGCTKNVPLVVLEGNKKYLASYEFETAGELNAKSKEMFRITDTFDVAAFDLYEFPKDGVIPDNWDKKKAVKVASIFDYYTDDIDRLDGITVADGTPVVEALKDQAIKGVKKAYNDGTAKERYNDYYDEVDLDVRLYYKGELNRKADKDMKESTEKPKKRVKESFRRRRMKEHATWYKKESFVVENDSYHPLRVLKDGKEYEGYYVFGCTASYWGDDRDLDRVESQLEDYDLTYLELLAEDSEDDIYIYEEDVGAPEIEEILKSLTVVLGNNRTMSFLDFMKDAVEDGVRDHEYFIKIDWDDWEGTPDLDDDY